MAITVGDLLNAQDSTFREDIGKTAYELMPEIGGSFFADMMLNDIGVRPAGEEIGRDWLFKSRYFMGLAGTIRSGNVSKNLAMFGNQTRLFGDTAGGAAAQNIAQLARGASAALSATAFINPLESPMPAPKGLTGRLGSIETALPMSLSLLRAEALPNVIQERVEPMLRGWAKNITLMFINSFFADPSSQSRLASLGPTSGDGAWTSDGTQKTITFYPVEKTTHKFMVGQAVDIFSSSTQRANTAAGAGSSTDPLKRVRMFVQNVDHWANRVVLVTDPAEVTVDGTAATFATWVATIGANAFVVPADSYGAPSATTGHPYGTSNKFGTWYGWKHWIRNSGNLLGDEAVTTTGDDYINVSTASEFKSGAYTGVGALDETKMLGYLANAERALDVYGYFIDTIIASEGVMLNVFDQTLAALRLNANRTGAVAGLSNMGLRGGLTYTTPSGRSYNIYESRFMNDGEMVGLRRSGNWEVLVPPTAKGVVKDGLRTLPRQIPLEMLIPALTGTGSKMFPITVAENGVNLPTEFSGIWGWAIAQLRPTQQIPGCYWTGVSTTRYFST